MLTLYYYLLYRKKNNNKKEKKRNLITQTSLYLRISLMYIYILIYM